MKIITLLILVWLHFPGFTQSVNQARENDITIDTVKFMYTIPGIDSTTSFVPQLRSRFNGTVISRINQHIRSYFMAGNIKPDSAEYVNQLLRNYEVKTLKEYREAKAREREEGTGEIPEEKFEIEYRGETFINIGYIYQVLPLSRAVPVFLYQSSLRSAYRKEIKVS